MAPTSSGRRGGSTRTIFRTRCDRGGLDRRDYRGPPGAAGHGSEAARGVGGVLAKDHRVGTVSPAAFPALRVGSRQPNFFVPRLDYYALPAWTNIYDTEPLRLTLSGLVDLKALADPAAAPGLLVSATDVEEGEIAYFYSHDNGLSLDHILASGSLPPSFPMTVIDGKSYWDGGLFDNTPLGAVLDRLDGAAGADRTIYVVNLFPNKAPVPRNMQEVTARTQNLQFANKTLEDVKMLRRIDEVAELMEALENLPEGNPLKDDSGLSSRGEAPLRPCPANHFDYPSGRSFGLRGQRFFAQDNRTACERRLQTDRAGAATVGEAVTNTPASKPPLRLTHWVLDWFFFFPIFLFPPSPTAGTLPPWSPQRFFNLGQDHLPIAFLGDRPDETVGDRAVALDNKSFGNAIDAPVDRGSPLAVGADPRKGVACLGEKARDVCRIVLVGKPE